MSPFGMMTGYTVANGRWLDSSDGERLVAFALPIVELLDKM